MRFIDITNLMLNFRGVGMGGGKLMQQESLLCVLGMAAPGWPGSCNTGIKVTSVELASSANVIRPSL